MLGIGLRHVPSPTGIASVQHRGRQQPPAFQSSGTPVAPLRLPFAGAQQRRLRRTRHIAGVSFAQRTWSNAFLPAMTCRLTPRCSGRHPGVISTVLASGVDQLCLRSPGRPGGAAELIVRYTTLRFLGELPPSRSVGQHLWPLGTLRLAIVGSEIQTRMHYGFSACSTDLRKLRRTPSLQRLQPSNCVEASSNPSLQRTPPG